MSAATEISRRPGRGRCLFAARDFAVGDLVLEVQPLSAVLGDEHVRLRCARCFALLSDNGGSGRGSRCAGCKNIWYCSRKCQKMDWVEHKIECKAWQVGGQGAIRKSTRTVRLAARILHLMNCSAKGDASTVPLPEQVRNEVAKLVDHNGDRPLAQQREYDMMATVISSLCVAGGGKASLSWPSADGQGFAGITQTIYGLIGKLACNVFDITVGLGSEQVGCGLYLEAAPVNHSCTPNVTQTFAFPGRTLSLRCTRPIRAGEEITIGITMLARPGRVRREKLKAGYFFDCRCERCNSKEGALEDARMDGYACPVTNCDGLCPSRTKSRGKNSNPDEELLRCDRCGATRSACEADRASRVIRDLLESSQDLVGRGEGHSGLAQAMEVLQEARSRASRCLHRGNWMVGEIYSSLVEIGIELEMYGPSAQYACEGIENQRLCWSAITPYYPAWGNQLAITGKLLLWRSQPADAVPYLEEAACVVRAMYGSEHVSYTSVRDILAQARAECGG